MNMQLQSVVISQKVDGSWQAMHVPSNKVAHGLTREEAESAMLDLLGMDDEGSFDEPNTSERFSGLAKDIAIYLEGPVSELLASHAGFARLEAFGDGVAHVRLGGGCEGCPSSLMTLVHGVKRDLQGHFGEESIVDVEPVLG